MSAAVAQAEKSHAAENARDQPVCMLSDEQKATIEENMECIKAKLELQDVGIMLFQRWADSQGFEVVHAILRREFDPCSYFLFQNFSDSSRSDCSFPEVF